MIQQIFNVVFPIFAIVLVGFLYARRHAPDMAAVNKINMDLFTPALIFHVLVSRDFEIGRYQDLAIAGTVVVLGSGLLAWPVARLLGYQVKTFVPPMMFSNSGNMGLPLMLFAFGEKALPAAVVLFMVENLLHFSVGTKMVNASASLLGLLRVPILIASILGLAFSLGGVHLPGFLATPIEMLGQICIPLMLFSLGVRLTAVDLRDWQIGLAGAVLCPLTGVLIVLGLQPLLQLPPQQFDLLLLFGALPPAVLNFMVAERYRQEPHRVASIVMLGNLASVVVIPLTLAFVL
jgi:predicted permease